jgi:hypothetical protein
MFIRLSLIELGRRLGAVVLGGTLIWQVIERTGPRNCEAVVHFAEPGLIVLVDGWRCEEGADLSAPVAWPLRPGAHRLQVAKEGKVVLEEDFSLEPGGQTVLIAHDATRPIQPRKVQLGQFQDAAGRRFP